MSSVKRSNVTSSEHGQLKAPDKWETSSKTTNALANNTSDTADTMSSSLSAAAKTQTNNQPQSQSRDAQKSANPTQQQQQQQQQQVTKNLDLDESELKNLLEEAYSYKGPKDKENKSETFKELLHKAELEDQKQDSFYSRQFRNSSRRHAHPHSGSLQDLVDSVNNEVISDCDYLGSHTRRHQPHSRYAKNSSSVSSRQREGGSLPNNVNSSGYPIAPFQLSKYPKSNTKNCSKNKAAAAAADTHDYERTPINIHRNAVIGESVSLCEETQPSIPSTSASVSSANEKTHTVINIEDPEEARHLLAHDSLAQNISETVRDDGTELMSLKKQRLPTMSVFSTNVVKDHGESSRQNCHVDQQIPFNSFLKSNGDTQPANKLLAKNPAVSNRYVLQNPPQAITNGKFDENGNAIVPKQASTVTPSQGKVKTKRNKGDRNIRTWTVPERGEDNIDQLLAFIENTDTTKKTNIINVNKNNLSVTERSKKEKKNAGNNKKEVSRLKKSTSMEELKSSSKIEEEIAQSERAQVSLRQQQQHAQKRNSTSDGKDLNNSKQSSSQMQPNKRGERRSWGTEELADFEAIDDRDTKKHKESNKLNTKNNNNNNHKKMELVASTNASIESIPTNIEAAEFHVVTKKKKTKKRQIIEEAKAKQQQMHQRNADQGHTHGRHTNSNAPMAHRYQPSSTYTNDRDIYVNSIMAKENRRKSTSSVPPSDKSDSSDLDSVHSLPVESTTTSNIISYAEIARKANQQQQEKLSNVNAWPPMSHNGKISESPENSNTSTSSSTVSSKSQSSNRSYDTIKASSPSDERTTLNMDESRMLDTPKSQQPASDCVKNQLQKSKSCDSEKYTTTMSLDQFPGLEKTVKPQKSHPNFASVLTSPPPPSPPQQQPLPPLSAVLTMSSTNSASERTNKGQVTKKTTATVAVTAEANHPKENAVKTQKTADEKVENSKALAADVNHTKLVFVQNSAKAEEIANSDSSNLFVPITMKKTKKSQHNSNSMPANVSSKNNSNGSQRTVRQTAVIFSDHETNHENVSPLLFGDFNDDILQLMKQEENHTDDERSAIDYAVNDCGQLKPNNATTTPMTSSQSDPGYASAHRTTSAPTESHGAIDIHQNHAENHVGNSTIAELTNKKSNVTKKQSLNKNNVNINNNTITSNNNHKISDVVSNQTLNNNNLSIGDTNVKAVSVSQQSISDSDSLNNNVSTQQPHQQLTNDSNKHDPAMKPSQQQYHHQPQQHLDGGINNSKSLNVPNHVHSTVSSATNQQMMPSTNPSNPGTHAYVNTTLDNITNGPNEVAVTSSSSTTTKVSSAVNEVVPVNSHPANVSQKNASCADTRVPLVVHHHNHNDIVNFVGSAWEEVLTMVAEDYNQHYFSGQ